MLPGTILPEAASVTQLGTMASSRVAIIHTSAGRISSRWPTAWPAPMNLTACPALARERVSTSWISNTRACAHSRPQARPTLPEPMILRVFTWTSF